MLDEKYKKEKISNINDEVKEFHPLLNSLFKKMIEISNVEYTHGQQEMGADFILTRCDALLDNIEYIAIVVKCVSIKQNFDDVKRQIEECFLVERKTENAKKKIYVSSVWVITSKNISENAKEKIYSLYKDKKISFIDCEKLISLIDKYYKEYWTIDTISISEYFKKVRDQIEKFDKMGQIIPIDENFYIPQDVELHKEYGSSFILSKKKRRSVNIFDEVLSSKISILQGDMGFGKSKLLREIALSYSYEQKYNKDKVIPFFCTFSDFVNKYSMDISSVIKGMDIQEYENDSRYLFLIDAVDEMGIDTEDINNTLADCITVFNNYKLHNVHVLFSMRYFPFLNDKLCKISFISYYKIMPMGFGGALQMIKNICKKFDITTRFVEDLKQSSFFKDMPKSPITALLLAKILHENALYELPCTMTELYSKYTEVVLGRWDMAKGLKKEKEYIIGQKFMTLFAGSLLEKKSFFLPYDEAVNILKDYLVKRNLDTSYSAEEILYSLIRDSGLLSEDLNKCVSFRHRTFFEFFLAQSFLLNNKLDIDNRVFDNFWSNIYYFYLGLKNDCPDELEKIIKLSPKDEQERWGKLLFTGQYFLASFMTPYQYSEKYFSSIFLEAAKLYHDIYTKQINSPFLNFSQGLLLFFIMNIIKSNFSYAYFSKSLTRAYLEIEETSYDDSIKSIAIFLLAIVERDLGRHEIIKYFVNNYCHKLGLDVLLISEIEKEMTGSGDIYFKKISKRLNSMSKAPNYRNALESIMKNSINDRRIEYKHE